MALARRLARALLADARARGDRPSASAFEFPRRARSSASASASSSSSTPKSDDSSSRASVALLAPAALTGALGAWQLARREEKIQAIDARARALETTVSASLARVGGGTPEYARASVAGELDLERTARVGPRARSVCGVTVPGSLIVTPVRLKRERRSWGWLGGRGARDDGAAAPAAETALLLRGWAPDSWTDVDPKAGACVKTGGVARASEMRGRFTPDNDPSEDRWFWLDAPALARSRGLPEDTPLIQAVNASEDESAAVVYPVAVKESELMAFPVSPDKHLGYAATWFTLSAFSMALAVAKIRRSAGYRL